jgi:hypothetical protein
MAEDKYSVVGPMRRIVVERQDEALEEDETIVEVEGEIEAEVKEDENGDGESDKAQEEGLPRIHIDEEAGNWMAELRANIESASGGAEPQSGILALPDSYVGQVDQQSYVKGLIGEQGKEESAIMKSLRSLLEGIRNLVRRESNGS